MLLFVINDLVLIEIAMNSKTCDLSVSYCQRKAIYVMCKNWSTLVLNLSRNLRTLNIVILSYPVQWDWMESFIPMTIQLQMLSPILFKSAYLTDLTIFTSKVLECLQSLVTWRSPRPSLIYNLFLYCCAFCLSRPSWLLFNWSLSTGSCPLEWIKSFIKPVLKSGDPATITG